MSRVNDTQKLLNDAINTQKTTVNFAEGAVDKQRAKENASLQAYKNATTDYKKIANQGYAQGVNTKSTYGQYNNTMNAAEQAIKQGVKYVPKYDEKINKLLNDVQNNKMIYNVSDDPAYKALANTYINQAQKGAESAVGEMVSMTGGYGSTSAVQAAQQAYTENLNGLNAETASLYDAAANRFMNEKNLALNLAQTYSDMDYQGWNKAFNEWQGAYQGFLSLANEYQSMYQYLDSVDRAKYETQLDAYYKLLTSAQSQYQADAELTATYSSQYQNARNNLVTTQMNAAGTINDAYTADANERQAAAQLALQNQAVTQNQTSTNGGITPKEVTDTNILKTIGMNRGDEGRFNKIRELSNNGKISDSEALWLLQHYNLL